MKKKTTRLLVILTAIAVAMTFSIMPVSAAAKTPAKVSGVKVTKATNVSVSLSWKKAKNAKKYEVYYKASSAKKWSSLKTKAKKATIKKLKANTAYSFKVRGINGKKKGKFSKVVKQKTFATPGQVNSKTIYASKRTRKDIVLTWKKAANASWYTIAAYSLGGDAYTPQQSKETTYDTVHMTKPNSWYAYKIRAVNSKTGKFPAVIGAWSDLFYTCTLTGDREITGTVAEYGTINYTMTGSDPFEIGRDDSLVPTGYYINRDEHNDPIPYTDVLYCDAVKIPADFNPAAASTGAYEPSNMAGKTFKVGDTFGSATIKSISFEPEINEDYPTGYIAMYVRLDDNTADVYSW